MQDTKTQTADRLEIIFYTDPLCCWSWAMEKSWRQLLANYNDQLSIRYCMGGLLESWQTYNDSVNSVTRPIQMGPVWMEAGHMTNTPIAHNIWMKDPPVSSYLACIAVKCAGMQSFSIEDQYLQLLREAIMLHGINIDKEKALVAVATQLSKIDLGFNLPLFREDLRSDKGVESFRKDLQEVRYRNINRFPTLIMHRGVQPGAVITGYRPYDVLKEAADKLMPVATVVG